MTWMKNAYIALTTGILLLIALALHGAQQHELKNIVLIISTFIAGIPIPLKAYKALRMKAFSIELLVTIAVIGALIIGEYVESAVVTFLFVFGAWLQTRTLEKTRSSLQKLIAMAPLEATVIRPEGNVTIAAEDIAKGDRILIRSGEKIAVDGPIVFGSALINEAAITGEPNLASKTVNDTVYSGTLIDSGYVEVIANRVSEDTTFSKMVNLMEEAQETKTKTHRFLERFANIYTPVIVVLSLLVYFFSGDIVAALTFLVIACPGALVISAPVSLVAGIGNGARYGILIKDGETMENLAKVDVVFFNKTGTLTMGSLEVTEVRTWNMTDNELLCLTAEAEAASEHHLGQSIVAEAQKRGLALVQKPENTKIIKGKGMTARINDMALVIGNRKLMSDSAVTIAKKTEDYAASREKAGDTAVFVAMNGILAGIISIGDQLRGEAKNAIDQLRSAGVKKICLLTGDNAHSARLVGEALGLDGIYAELLPEDKVAWVNKLRAQGHKVAMAGDGVTDAPALTAANVGVAMGAAGSDVSMDIADVVLMTDRLDPFSHAYSLARATLRNMKQNTCFAVGTVVILLFGVLLGRVFLASGMLIHELSVLIVILNAVRLTHYKTHRHAGLPVSNTDYKQAAQVI